MSEGGSAGKPNLLRAYREIALGFVERIQGRGARRRQRGIGRSISVIQAAPIDGGYVKKDRQRILPAAGLSHRYYKADTGTRGITTFEGWLGSL